MALSKARPAGMQREQGGPDTLRALKESLIQDSRLSALEDESRVPALPLRSHQSAGEEFHQAPSITTSQPSVGSDLKPDYSRADVNHPNNSDAASEAILSDVIPHQAGLENQQDSSDGRSIKRRVFVTGAYGFIFIAAVCAVAFLPPVWAEKTKNAALGWYSSLTKIASALHSSSPRTYAEQQDSVPPTEQVSTPASIAPSKAPVASSPAAVEAVPSIDLRQQLDALVSKLVTVQGLIEQLSTRQEQMALDIATLKAAQQNLSQQISLLPSFSTTRFRAHRKPVTDANTDKIGRRSGG
jgi:hypothetical protein